MKRLFAMAALLIMLTACAPDNVIPSPDVEEQPEQTETPAPAPEQNGETTETPKTEEETVPEGAVIYQKKEANKEVAPTYKIKEDTSLLKDKMITMYTVSESAFTAGSLDEKAWFDALKDSYGLTVKYSYRNSNTLHSSQSIALKSGITLDVITAKINDMAQSLGLMQSAESFIQQTESPFYSASVFAKSGNRVFTGKGNSRMLWYNADVMGDDSPYTLFTEDSWTTEVLSATQISFADKDVRLIECSNWISFGSAGTEQVTGTIDGAYTFSVTSENSRNAFNAFATITSKDGKNDSSVYGFSKGNTLFKLTSDPGTQSFKLGFVPIPKHGTDGSYVAELCGMGLGISKTATAETAQVAAVFASLWSARYTESRADKLMAVLGFEKAEKYIDFTETGGMLTNTDAQNALLFEGNVIPAALYGDDESVYNSFASGYNRATLINARNQ